MAKESVGITLARRLRALIESRQLSQSTLARMSGVAQKTISNVLNYSGASDRHATIETVEALARALGLQPWELLRQDMARDGAGAARGPNVADDLQETRTALLLLATGIIATLPSAATAISEALGEASSSARDGGLLSALRDLCHEHMNSRAIRTRGRG